MRRGARLALTFFALAIPVGAQEGSVTAPLSVRAKVPFGIGERAEYNLKYGFIHAGVAVSEILAIDSVRDRRAWHAVFRLRGGIIGFRINDRFESWMDVDNQLSSLRHWQDVDEGPYERELKYEIFPERREYVEGAREPQPSVELPLDDGSFVFFLRTMELEVGETYKFDRYFRPDRNPVRIQVLRREQITVPAGTFNTIVVKPIIKTRGIFAENGRAEVWISDDSARVMVQMKTHVKIGTLTLQLRRYDPPTAPGRDSVHTDTVRRDSAKRDTTKPDSSTSAP